MKRLPRSLDDVGGLRVARWIRESTTGQLDRYGPDSQREMQDAFIERFKLVDTGLVYTVAHSGTTVWRSPVMAEMLADAAAGKFDLLLAGYFDRWQRNIRRTLELVEDHLHPAGAAWVMCDRRLLSSDPGDWREMRRLANEAQEYSERLAERVVDGYAAKFRRLADQAGNAPIGLRRRTEPPHVLEVDPDTIGIVVRMFERYATGTIATDALADELGIGVEQVAKALRNPIYNGWARRHRGVDEERMPTSWRADPPISDELWSRVEEMRRRRTRSSGKNAAGRVDPLNRIVWCACGQRLRSNGTSGNGPKLRRMRYHPKPCADWGRHPSRTAAFIEAPVFAQIEGLRVDARTVERIVRLLGQPVVAPSDTTRARIERQKRELALDHASGKLTDEAYLARIAALRDAAAAVPSERPLEPIDAASVRTRLESIAAVWARADDETRSEVLHSIYDRIEVEGDAMRAELTPAAMEIGLHLALPESVYWRPRTGPGAQVHTRIEIVGRREALAAARKLA